MLPEDNWKLRSAILRGDITSVASQWNPAFVTNFAFEENQVKQVLKCRAYSILVQM